MDRDSMLKIKWKPYMLIDYKPPRVKESVECFLIAINFDDEILTLQPTNSSYDIDDFTTNLKYCEPSRQKLKKV